MLDASVESRQDGFRDDPLDRLDELISLLLDDALEDDMISEMEALLAAGPDACRRYVDFAQLHGDLREFYQRDSEKLRVAETATARREPS